MDATPTSVRVFLGYTRAEDVEPDPDRPGLQRARTRPLDGDPREVLDFRSFALHDCADPTVTAPSLEEAGFEAIDLSGEAPLQEALATVQAEDRISEASAEALRAAIDGTRFRLANGRSLQVQHVAGEGLFLRCAGPNGLRVYPKSMDGAAGVHADQDVFGTPLLQLMGGNAPRLFRHRTPDARNDEASLFLLNLWIPIQQITRPLVLMDRRTLDAPRHQLRYGLPVTRFLDRDAARAVNDIWTFLPDSAQTWYYRSEMGPEQAWIFDTLGAPHASCMLPGEEALAALHAALGETSEAVAAGDADSVRAAAGATPLPLPEVTTAPIRAAWRRMTALLEEAAGGAEAVCAGEDWTARARRAMDAVVRKSVEMRLVAGLVAD